MPWFDPQGDRHWRFPIGPRCPGHRRSSPAPGQKAGEPDWRQASLGSAFSREGYHSEGVVCLDGMDMLSGAVDLVYEDGDLVQESLGVIHLRL